MSGDIAPLPQYALMARCSVKVQGQLYLFTFIYRLGAECVSVLQDLIPEAIPRHKCPMACFRGLKGMQTIPYVMWLLTKEKLVQYQDSPRGIRC